MFRKNLNSKLSKRVLLKIKKCLEIKDSSKQFFQIISCLLIPNIDNYDKYYQSTSL